jgi:hypothetical protein
MRDRSRQDFKTIKTGFYLMNKSAETLINRYGKDYFSKLGKKGSNKFYQIYYLVPCELNKFAIMRKSDNSFVNYLGYKR